MKPTFLIVFTILSIHQAIADDDVNAGRTYLHSMLNRIQNDRLEPKDMTDNFINDDHGYDNFVFSDDEMWNNMNITEPQPTHSTVEGTRSPPTDTKEEEIPIEELIKIIFKKPNGDKEGIIPMKEDHGFANIGTKPETGTGTEQGPVGYYYYLHPFKNLEALKDLESELPPEFAQAIKTMKPMMPAMPMMPMGPNKMKPMAKTPVGPLFVSMLWFVGTALVFIVSILLMPRVKFVKVKSISEPLNIDLAKIDEKLKEIINKLGR